MAPECVNRPPRSGAGLAPPGPLAFIWTYVRRRSRSFGLLIAGVVCAAGAAVSVQYVLKMLVDIMAGPEAGRSAVWMALGFFVGLIAFENLCWRMVGWLTCRTTVGAGVEMRLDLFDQLNRQPMRYFADNLAGSLGQRITATAGHFGAFVNTLVWRVLPPCIDFAGALIIFASINRWMTAALAASVVLVTTLLIWFGERGRPRHRDYSGRAGAVAGELVDTIGNMWAVKAFSARGREFERLRTGFEAEAASQRGSWMHIEKARLIHDGVLCVAAAGMLTWAITLWTAGQISPGDVVVVSTLTFRILHSSRDLALSLVDVGQHLGFIDDTLRTIGQKQTVVDRPGASALAARTGAIEFRDVSFAYPGQGAREAAHRLNLTIPGGQKIGIVGPSPESRRSSTCCSGCTTSRRAASSSTDSGSTAWPRTRSGPPWRWFRRRSSCSTARSGTTSGSPGPTRATRRWSRPLRPRIATPLSSFCPRATTPWSANAA